MKQLLFAANWKMYLSANEELAYLQEHKKTLSDLAQTTNARLSLFPSFPSLSHAKELFTNTPLLLGAQDCSAYEKGPYTGQVSATTLAQVGCTFCIIGHNEQRKYHGVTDEIVTQKVMRAVEAGITPIICVGEIEHEHRQDIRNTILKKQLVDIIKFFKESKSTSECVIAYEPVWAIGTGTVAHPDDVAASFAYIKELWGTQGAKLTLLYGGSISGQTAGTFKALPDLGGFLIGQASTDFQEFKKIVLS